MPPNMAFACEAAGEAKAARDTVSLLILGLLAEAFIAFNGHFMQIVLTRAGELPWGVVRLFAGLVFSLGLILVIVGGAELFAGDPLMIVTCASRRIEISALPCASMIVYAGNNIGAVGTTELIYLSGMHGFNAGQLGKTALAIAIAKAALPTFQVFVLGVRCNVLVCLAFWMSFGAQSTTE